MPTQACPRAVRSTLIGAAAALSLAAARPARAAECQIEVTGPGAGAWELAARGRSLSALDCQSVVIETTGDGARLTFTTPGGKTAERMLVAPDEVGPALDALRVTIPPQPLTEPEGATVEPAAPAAGSAAVKPTALVPAVVPAASPPPEHDAASPAGAARTGTSSGPIIALLGGVRGSLTDRVSPVLAGSIAWPVYGLELGAVAACEVQYTDPASTSLPSERGAAVAFGVSLDLRSPLGPVAVLTGVRATYALLLPSTSSDPAGTPTDDRFGEGRIGLLLGAAVPRSATLRFRTELGAELVLAPQPSDSSTTPARAVSLAIGLEMGGT